MDAETFLHEFARPQSDVPPGRPSADTPFTGEEWTACFDGALLNGNSPIILEEVSGLLDAPEIRTSDAELLQRDGLVPGTDYMGGRSVGLSFLVTDPQAVPRVLSAFRAGGDERLFRFSFPGIANGLGQLLARVRRRSARLDERYVAGARRFDVELFATDPRVYAGGTSPQSATIPVQVPRAGKAIFPLSFPFTLADEEDATPYASPTVVNYGSAVAYPVITLVARDGTVQDPEFSLWTAGTELTFSTVGLTLVRGSTLVLDMANRRITVGGSSRAQHIKPGSQWFGIPPGEGQFQLRVKDGPEGLAAEAVWRSAWL
ncbi:phage distal tail protein [Kitasatospora sp. McL0602]|uniref:phage distal tail protein n=1 Tax=Kitasatospora sp. McL0602 TaxID=3439530 RepID=UPI003F889EA7